MISNNNIYQENKAVRVFYCLVLQHAIPCNLKTDHARKKDSVALLDKECAFEHFEPLHFDINALMEPRHVQVAFDKKAGVRPLANNQTTYLVPFLVSKVFELKAEDITSPRQDYSGFKIKDSSLSALQESLVQDVRDTLCEKMEIHELDFIMATSRRFDFEISYEGSFRVKRKFSDEDVESEEGVKNALAAFFDEIGSVIEPFGFQVTSTPSTHRRSRDDEYRFGVYYEPVIGLSENDVHGEGCYALSGDASIDEINEYGVDFENLLEDEINAYLSLTLEENLPLHVDLISSEINYIDGKEKVFDISDELISSQKLNLDVCMLKRAESELQILVPRDSLPTVEVDVTSIPEGLNGYSDLVTKALASVAEKSIKLRATVYVYQGISCNFNQQSMSMSAFFGVAGNKKILDVLLNAFQEAGVVNVRFSDYIDPSTAVREFHVQDGYVWRPLEEGTWFSKSEDSTDFEGIVDIDIDIETEEFDNELKNITRTATPTRFRAARADTTVGTIRQKIEDVFGLPAGSIAICGPDKRALRGDATIATVRKRWE